MWNVECVLKPSYFVNLMHYVKRAIFSTCMAYTKTIIHLDVGNSGGYLPRGSANIQHYSPMHVVCLVNKPLSAADISEDNSQGRKKNEQLAEKLSFEGNFGILRPIFKPRALSPDKPANRTVLLIL